MTFLNSLDTKAVNTAGCSVALKGIRVCFFGHYDPNYSRNRIIMKALRRAGASVVEIRSCLSGIARYRQLLKVLRTWFDIMWVGFPSHTDMPLAKIVCLLKRRPLIFDPLISYYDSIVWDRKLFRPKSFDAYRMYLTDWLSCRLADIVVLDTNTHIDYFVATFNIPRSKCRCLYVGADDEVMFPKNEVLSKDPFVVFFYGTFIPLHGIEHIIEAAAILEKAGEDISFIIVGSGQIFPAIRHIVEKRKLKSIRLLGKLPYEELPRLMNASHICLGIFGTTPKAQRVIPNKIFDAIAVARSVITADTPAVREVFTHGKDIYLVPPGDPKALAHAILTLKQNPILRNQIATAENQIFKERFSIQVISTELIRLLKEVL